MSITPKDPADFSPSLSSYRETGSFRFWCQKVLPLVYDDSLSYYELLCKVVNYLNSVIENVDGLHEDVTNMHTAYDLLQNYVNTYFDTLDVQEEINNKLDSMADDGSLSALIQPLFDEYKTEIDDEIEGFGNTLNNAINTQNQAIDVLEARMDEFSKLPDGSLSTAADAELVDIRVGADGSTYPTAGDSVREQVRDLKSALKQNPLSLNLLPMVKSAVINGVTFTVNADGSITANGNATNNANFHFFQWDTIPDTIQKNVLYTLMFDNSYGSHESVSGFLFIYKNGSIDSNITIGDTPKHITFGNDVTGLAIFIQVRGGVSVTSETVRLILTTDIVTDIATDIVTDIATDVVASTVETNDITILGFNYSASSFNVDYTNSTITIIKPIFLFGRVGYIVPSGTSCVFEESKFIFITSDLTLETYSNTELKRMTLAQKERLLKFIARTDSVNKLYFESDLFLDSQVTPLAQIVPTLPIINILPAQLSRKNNGITYTVNNDGSVSLSGEATQNSNFFYYNSMAEIPDGLSKNVKYLAYLDSTFDDFTGCDFRMYLIRNGSLGTPIYISSEPQIIELDDTVTGFYAQIHVDSGVAPGGTIRPVIASPILGEIYNAVNTSTPHVYTIGENDNVAEIITTAMEHKGSIVYIEPYTHDCIQEWENYFGSGYWDNLSSGRGIGLRNDIHIIGRSGCILQCHYTGNNDYVQSNFSLFNNPSGGSGYTIENVIFDVSKIRYVIHDERASDTTPYKVRYSRCRMSQDNSESTWDHSRACIGGGLGAHGDIVVEDCIFNTVTSNANKDSLAYHNSASAEAQNSIVIKNCYCEGDSTLQLASYGASTLKTKVIVANCSFGSAIEELHWDSATNPDGNFDIFYINNEIRNA